jgi:IS5 family transposase
VASTLGPGIEAVFHTTGDQPSLWEWLLPEEVLRLPAELAPVDALLDGPAFFARFAPDGVRPAGGEHMIGT